MAQITGYDLQNNKDLVAKLYFDAIFNFIFLEEISDPQITKSFDIFINLLGYETYRKKLCDEGYLKRVFNEMQVHVDDILADSGVSEFDLEKRLLSSAKFGAADDEKSL